MSPLRMTDQEKNGMHQPSLESEKEFYPAQLEEDYSERWKI